MMGAGTDVLTVDDGSWAAVLIVYDWSWDLIVSMMGVGLLCL